MQTLTATGVNKAYGDKQLLQDVNFLINEGNRIGLIGVNGTGKTTLLEGLAGTAPFDDGSVEAPKNYRIAYLAQQPSLPQADTIMDAVYGGDAPVFAAIREYEAALAAYGDAPMSDAVQERYTKAMARMDQTNGWDAETEIKTILTQLHLDDLTQKIGTLSGGQAKRVGLAQVLIEQPDLLMLDEPTNHLDFDSVAWLEKYLAAYKGALLVVTHDRYFLDRVANQIWELDRGQLQAFNGNYQDYVAQKAEQNEREDAMAHKQAQLYKHELAWMREGAHARSTKQNARVNRFKAMSNGQQERPTATVDIDIGTQRLGKKVIEMSGANLRLGDHVILSDFDWLVQPGKRIGITGVNGAGKSSLLNVITGLVPLDSGTLAIGETVKFGYYQQQMPPMDGDERVISYLQSIGEGVTNSQGEHQSVTQLLDAFLFPRAMHGTRIDRLSGGERRRLYLLQILMQQPNVLLLDEPTNDLDIATLTVLEDYLDSFPGTVITVSHDRYFLDKVADQLLVFAGGGQIERAVGRFTDYLAQQAQAPTIADNQPVTKPSSTASPAEAATPKKKFKLTYAEQKEYEGLMPQIDALDQQISDLEAAMAATDGYDYQTLGGQQQQLDELNAQQEKLMERYLALDEYVAD